MIDGNVNVFVERRSHIQASKGLYCFDITDYDNDDKYGCIATPEKAINISNFPSEIQELLSDHTYNRDVSKEHTITVDHAY